MPGRETQGERERGRETEMDCGKAEWDIIQVWNSTQSLVINKEMIQTCNAKIV